MFKDWRESKQEDAIHRGYGSTHFAYKDMKMGQFNQNLTQSEKKTFKAEKTNLCNLQHL